MLHVQNLDFSITKHFCCGTYLDEFFPHNWKTTVDFGSILGRRVTAGCSMKVMQPEKENKDAAARGFGVW